MAEERSKRRKMKHEIDDTSLAKDAIKLHLIGSSDELHDESANTFSPEFVEEHFGEDGLIHGYQGLKVDIWVHCATFHVFAEIKYDAIFQLKKKQKSLPTLLKEIFGAALVEDRNTFIGLLATYDAQFSQLIEKFGERLSSSDTANTHVQIHRFDLNAAEVREWHKRLNPFILWFVESARCIEEEDPRWEVYVAVETISEKKHRVLGICNVYRFFHFFDYTRLRISQIMVFPPYQKKQYGCELVKSVNETAIRRNCYDVTMEDPSDRLKKLRDCIDVVRLMSYQPLVDALPSAVEMAKAKDVRALLPPRELVGRVVKEFKISKQQMKRCWEALLFLQIASEDASGKVFRELLLASVHADLYGTTSASGDSRGLKRIVNTYSEFDSSKTFVMMRFRRVPDAAEPEDMESAVPKPEPQLVEEMLKQREDRLAQVVMKVAELRGKM